MSNFFADVSIKIITMADPVLSQRQTWNGNGFFSGQCLYSLIHDLPRIAGPSCSKVQS
jgi:hypothetical protein